MITPLTERKFLREWLKAELTISDADIDAMLAKDVESWGNVLASFTATNTILELATAAFCDADMGTEAKLEKLYVICQRAQRALDQGKSSLEEVENRAQDVELELMKFQNKTRRQLEAARAVIAGVRELTINQGWVNWEVIEEPMKAYDALHIESEVQ